MCLNVHSLIFVGFSDVEGMDDRPQPYPRKAEANPGAFVMFQARTNPYSPTLASHCLLVGRPQARSRQDAVRPCPLQCVSLTLPGLLYRRSPVSVLIQYMSSFRRLLQVALHRRYGVDRLRRVPSRPGALPFLVLTMIGELGADVWMFDWAGCAM